MSETVREYVAMWRHFDGILFFKIVLGISKSFHNGGVQDSNTLRSMWRNSPLKKVTLSGYIIHHYISVNYRRVCTRVRAGGRDASYIQQMLDLNDLYSDGIVLDKMYTHGHNKLQ